MSDRRYRQRGYKDSEREDRPSREKKPPREKKEGPWGRGLGAPKASVFRCSACGGKVDDLPDELPLDTVCPHCGVDLHTCTHCVNFDPAAPGQCREDENIPKRVPKKAKRNECPLFTPKVSKEFGQESITAREARAAFDDLFKF